MSQPPSVTLIAGPTASGKSALALQMARETGAVIINADSQQLYADLRVLTARPSPEDEAQADHRLYGIADAAESWSVGRWSRVVANLITQLHAEKKPVIIVGGTGLYFLALTRGLADIPPVPTATRDALEAEYLTLGETVFRARLAQVDPNAAYTIEQGDRQRLVRAMGVYATEGRSLSALKASTQPLLKPGSWTGVVIEKERNQLYERCNLRVDWMLNRGAFDEVRALTMRNLPPSLPLMKAVGLRELAMCLAGDLKRDDAVEAVKQATRNYAKRQMTWFRNQARDWPRRYL